MTSNSPSIKTMVTPTVTNQDGDLGKVQEIEEASRCGRFHCSIRCFTMAVLASAYFTMGLNLTIFGLTLPSLAENMNETIKSLGPALVMLRGGGYLVGSALCGGLEGKVKIGHILLSSLLVVCVGQTLTPLILNKAALFVSSTFTSVGLGALETVGNVWCLQLWGKKVEPQLQFLQFCVCFGCAVVPFMAMPFLNENYLASELEGDVPILTIGGSDIPYVSVIYFVIVTLTASVALLGVALRCLPSAGQAKSQQKNTIAEEGKNFRRGMLIFMFLFFFFYAGMEATFLAFLFAFCEMDNDGLRYSKDGASKLNALFFFSVTFGQFVAIFLSRKFSPAAIVFVDLLVLLLSTVAMACLPLYALVAPRLFWVVLALAGLSGASVYGSMFLWAERYITVNGRAASIFIVGASLGEMMLPFPVGSLIEQIPMTFLYFEVVYAAVLIFLFAVMVHIASLKGTRLKRFANNDNDEKTTKVGTEQEGDISSGLL